MYWEHISGICDTGIQALYSKVIDMYDNATFVEIGAWKGKSAMFMAEKIKSSKKNIRFYTIDIFEYTKEYDEQNIGKSFYEETLKNLKPLEIYTQVLKGTSESFSYQFENESIDFLFIDGDHTYESVKNDIFLWFPKIKKGGIISGHDYTEPCGVKKAVDEFFSVATIIGTSWALRK